MVDYYYTFLPYPAMMKKDSKEGKGIIPISFVSTKNPHCPQYITHFSAYVPVKGF